MLHREHRRLFRLLKRAEEATDAFDLARMGDNELDELLRSGQLKGDNLTKARYAKHIRSIYGADAAFSRYQRLIENELLALPDNLLSGLVREDSSEILKNLVKSILARRAEGRRLNTPGSTAANGSVQPDWWRDK
jgi:hypothetical protein